ncbi:hypothetical protein FRC00_008789 [Tulasnella sp. 408]|nr:hypothetical protein FRC00_008789 [Tulasnella sp. 408]
MRNLLATTLATLGLFASTWSSPTPPTPPGTVFCLILRTGPPIVATTFKTFVTGYQLAVDITPATLNATGWTGGFDFDNGGIGAFDGCHHWYLNIGSSTKSYKPLSWAFDNQISTNWIASEGSPVSAAATAEYGASSSFLTCKEGGKWHLYLQTGNDWPSGLTCTTTKLAVGTS